MQTSTSRFITHLNDIIDQSGRSKNQLLRDCGMERSTFFQILAGKRRPTPAQLGRILWTLSSAPVENGTANAAMPVKTNDALLEEYLSERLSASDFQIWQSMRRFVALANQKENLEEDTVAAIHSTADLSNTAPVRSSGDRRDTAPDHSLDESRDSSAGRSSVDRRDTAPDHSLDEHKDSVVGHSSADHRDPGNPVTQTAAKIASFVDRQLGVQEGRLDFYLSPSLIEQFQLGQICARYWENHLHLRQIIGAPLHKNEEATSVFLTNLASLLHVLAHDVNSLKIYCAVDSHEGKTNQLFPYYLLGANELLLISHDGMVCTLVREAAVVASYQERFENILRDLTPMFTSLDNYQTLAGKLYERYQNFGEQTMLFVAERPCALQLVTPDMITKYIHDPAFAAFSQNYTHSLQSIHNFVALMSPEGLAAFEKDRQISEAGMNFPLDAQDMRHLNAALARLRGKRMLTVPAGNCFLKGWEIAIYNQNEVILSLFDSTDCVLSFQGNDIAKAFVTYYESFRRIFQDNGHSNT